MNEHLLNLVKMIPLTFAALFPVINPIGTAIILLGMTGTLDRTTRHYFARKIAINSVLILGFLLLAGSYVLSFFGITIPIVQAAGGMVLASMGWNMLKDSGDKEAVSQSPSTTELNDRLVYPFTFPITVGPGSIAVTLTLSAHAQHDDVAATAFHQAGVAGGIIAICVLLFFCLLNADLLTRRLGPSGTKVLLRLMAFVLVCLGAEIFWSGAETLLKQAFFKS